MVWKFINGGFVDVPEETPPELTPVVEGPAVTGGANPMSTEYQAALDAYFANPEGGFNYTPKKSADELYSAATTEPASPLTEAVVKPPVVQPPAPVVAPQAAPAPTAQPTAQPDPVQQLQELVAPPDDLGPVEDQDLGLTGQINENSNPPAIPQPQGLLTGADAPMPQVPISGNNLDMSQFTPEQLQPAPAPVKPQPSLVDETVQQGRQLLSGALANATATPIAALAALSSLVAIPARKLGFEGPANATAGLVTQAEKMRQGADFATGANPEPQTPGQTLARTVGRNASPSAVMSAGMTGADLLSQAITPSPAGAKPSMTKEQANALLFPNEKPVPSVVRVTHTMPTAGGPASVSDGDLKTLGLMGVLTMGALFAPAVVRKINSTVLPKFNLNQPRDVVNAAQGTEAISNRIDLARTYDDVNAGIFRVARRAGVDPLALSRTQDLFTIQTGGAARNLVNTAVLNGEMQTPTFTFKVSTPISQLARQDSKPFRDYLHASDTIDDIVQKEARIQNKGPQAVAQQAAIGPVTVRGMTIQDALRVTNGIRQTNPEVLPLAKAYRENVKELRRFMSTGQYATLSKQEMQRLNRESQNFVPWKDQTGSQRVLGSDAPERLSPFDALMEEMQQAMRFRMENEARGAYIDNMRKAMPSSFVKISPQEFRDNPHWEKQVVSVYRRGKLERYTTDPFLADVLNHDPYAVSGTIAQGLYASKRLMESTATGVLAPWFASTSALRSWQIAKITTPEGLKPPTLIGMTRAVPEQLIPQIARSIHQSIDNGGWISSVLGQQASQALSRKLADTYANSFYALMERSGTHQGSFLQHHKDFQGALDKMLRGNIPDSARKFVEGYKQFLNAIHSSPSFDFAMKNYNAKNPPQLAFEARHLTGDPQTAGQFLVDGKRAIRMDKPLFGSDIAGKAATLGTQGYGFLTGVGREAIPWWNITTQGAKRIGESYVNNPTKFVAKTWLYQAVPAASLFMFTRGAGIDPTGKSYNDYQMRGRSEYNKLMNWYIPIPGRPAEDGFEVPRFHELAPFAHMMEVGLDHLVRSSSFEASEDFMRAAFSLIGLKDTFPKNNAGAIFQPGEDLGTLGKSFAETAVFPPTPPLVSLSLASQGMVMPQGLFGGEAYAKKQDPYDQLGGMNAQFELMIRALGTGLADVIGSGYAAYTQTPEGVAKGLKNAMTEGSKRMIMKTPIARDMFDIKPGMSGNTDITSQLFKKEKVINNLSRYYRTWTREGGNINTKMASERGGLVVEKLLGNGPPNQSAGLDQPPPTNPLYIAFMEEVYNKFNKDSPDKKVNPNTGAKSSSKGAVWVPDEEGGIGAKSLWRRYGDYSTQLKRLRQINDGNLVTWQLELSQRPDQIKYLKENNVDYRNPRSVRNFYEQKRQEVAKQILFTIRAVEEDFTRRLGKPFKIEDLDPYAKAPQQGQVMEETPTIPPWSDGMGLQ